MGSDEPSTYGALHAGDVVRGADGQEWGVLFVGEVSDRFSVALVRHGERVNGWPAPGDPIFVVRRCDTSAEARAFDTFLKLGILTELIGETWESR